MQRMTLLVLLAGCGGAGTQSQTMGDTAGDFVPLAAPTNGLQIILPVVKDIAPHTDKEVCTWTSTITTADMDVQAVEGFQSATGHHTVLFSTQLHEVPGTTRDCTDDDMATFRFAAGSGGEGQGMRNEAPGNLVYRIPEGHQLVINHHYINSGSAPKDAQSGMNIYFADTSAGKIPSSSLAFVDTSMRVATGVAEVNFSCTMTKTVKVWQFFPHMHQYGKHIVIEHTGATTERLFDLKWSPGYQFHPPDIRRDPSEPYVLNAGDTMNVHCEWDNETGKEITFGIEMCIGFGATVDDSGVGNILCDNGDWGKF